MRICRFDLSPTGFVFRGISQETKSVPRFPMGQIYKSYVWQIEYRYVTKIPSTKAIKHVEEFKKMAYTSTFTYPLVIKTGRECEIEDVDGIKFLDFTSNIGSCPVGYSHPEILDVIKDYSSIEKGVNKIAGQDFYCEEHLTIAKKLLSVSKKNSRVFFINSGAEAVENAIKIAYKNGSSSRSILLQ